MNDVERPYVVEERRIIAETAELSVKTFILAEGQEIPWHYHSEIVDTFYCLEGRLTVETRAPKAFHALDIGETCAVQAKVAHRVQGEDGSRCRFLIVQGIGTYDYCPVG